MEFNINCNIDNVYYYIYNVLLVKNMIIGYSEYNYEQSRDRLDSILSNENEKIREEKNKFPKESWLTFDNIVMVTVDVISVDLRKSTKLSNALAKNNIKLLTKLYRAYISEVIVVMKGDENIERVYIEGDGVWGIFSSKDNINTPRTFDTAAKISAIIKTLNVKLLDKGLPMVTIGMGMETGKSYYAKAGYKYSGINAEVWVGKIVNKAFKLGDKANKNKNKELVISANVYSKLDEKQKKLMKKNKKENMYHGHIVDGDMKKWLDKHSSPYLKCDAETNYCYIPISNRKRKWYKLWLGY